MNYASNLSIMMGSCCASYWLKDALASALKRDPIDAARDAATLAAILAERADAILSESDA